MEEDGLSGRRGNALVGPEVLGQVSPVPGGQSTAARQVLTMNAFFSSTVWKRPWPNLEVVSINFRSIFSRARRLVCTSKDCGPRGEAVG